MTKLFTNNYYSYFLVRYLPCSVAIVTLLMQQNSMVSNEYIEIGGILFFCILVPYSLVCYSLAGYFKNLKWLKIFVAERFISFLLPYLSFIGIIIMFLFFPDTTGLISFRFPLTDEYLAPLQLYSAYISVFFLGMGIRIIKERFIES